MITGRSSPVCRISVVIPTFHRDILLQSAIASLQRQTLPANQYEIIVVDNGQSDSTARLVASLAQGMPCLRYVREPHPGALLHEARHTGARHARAEVVAYTDDDALCDPGWLVALLTHFDDSRVGAAGGPIEVSFPEGAPAWLSKFADCYAYLNLGDSRRDLEWPDSLYAPNLALRKSALIDAGGFDPELAGREWLGPGESGLNRKLLERGWTIVYEPLARVTHVISRERATGNFVVERLRQHAACAAYLHCAGNPSRIRLALRALKYALAAVPLSVGASIAHLGFRDDVPVRLASWAAYARAHAAWDINLMKPGPKRDAITRTDWYS